MKYSELRPLIKTGDLFFSAKSHPLSRFIRLITRSGVSHVGNYVWLEGRLFVAEATFYGYQLTLASRYQGKEYYHGRSSRDNNTEEEKKEIIFTLLGTKYDWKGMILSPFLDTKSKQKFCSEASSTVLGIRFPFAKRGVYPLDLANGCAKLMVIEKD